MNNFRPYWYGQALKEEGEPQANPLTEDIKADVCIIGGGYTGLWTAIQLKDREPELDIVIIEQKLCGYGASGCNGGCVLTLSTKYLSLKKFYGKKEAQRLIEASEEAVHKIKDFTEHHNIDCDLRIDGALYIATNESQLGVMDPVLNALDEKKINSWDKMPLDEAKKFAATDEMHEAFYSPSAGSVQPAKLVRGLARVARDKGIKVFEDTPMKEIVESHPPKVITPNGSVTAKKVVVAINAWMASKYKKFERTMAVVSSDMGITEPIPELLDELKLKHGPQSVTHVFSSTIFTRQVTDVSC